MTVAVPVKDRRERMLRCLEDLLALDYPSYDVLVMDNISTDGTPEACRERAGDSPVEVRVVSSAGSVGHLRNRAAELGAGPLVAYTDSDCAPSRGWLRAAVAPFRDPGVGIVQGRTAPDPGVEVRDWAKTRDVAEYSGLFEACNLVALRDELLAAGGFDEEVFFGEDTAAGAALLGRGWRAAFAPEALVHHDVTYPDMRWWLRQGLRYGNLARVVRRHPELRRELLWCRLFIRPRSARFALAAAGLALAPLDRRALALTLPYAWYRRPPNFGWRFVAFDAAVFAGSVAGSIRHRAPLL